MKAKTYLDTELGNEIVEYLRVKSKRLTVASESAYELALATLALHYPDLTLSEFEPPDGTRLLEDFLAHHWGDKNPKTYNKNLSVICDFFKWQVIRRELRLDPTSAIERAKPRQFLRTTFTVEQRNAILNATRDLRYRLAVRLLLDYGIRKGALAAVQLAHFDRGRQRLTIFTKGEKIHVVPIPDPEFWAELAQIEDEPGSQPGHYLMGRQRVYSARKQAQPITAAMRKEIDGLNVHLARLVALNAEGSASPIVDLLSQINALLRQPGLVGERIISRNLTEPAGEHALHDWWYRRLECAGIVEPGTTSGRRMHTARHTAGQRVLEATGNLVAVQQLLGHSSITTTGNNYVGWEVDQLHDTMRRVLSPNGNGE